MSLYLYFAKTENRYLQKFTCYFKLYIDFNEKI